MRVSTSGRTLRLLLAAVLALAGIAVVQDRADAGTLQFHGVNWADQRDNFVDGVLYVSGLGSADTYIGDNELRRDAQGMDKALTLARMRENADLHERMVAQGVSPEDLADAGFLTHDEIDEAESDGTIEEAAFGLAARFREWMVKRDHGKFSKKNVAGDAPAAPAARPAAPAPAQRGARPKPFVPKPRPAQAARPAAPAPAAPAPAQKPLAADAAPDERATHPALPKSPGVLGMGKIKPEDMHAIDDDMRAMVKAGEDEKPKQNFNGADDLFKAATEDFDPFKGLLDQAAQGLGGKTVDIKKAEKDAGKGISKPMLVMGPMKKMERAKQKVDTKYDGDWNRLQDVLRATMVVPTLADAVTAMQTPLNMGIGGSLDCGTAQPFPPDGVVTEIWVPQGFYDVWATFGFGLTLELPPPVAGE